MGLSEAIKAAANQRQSNRSSLSPSTPTNGGNSSNDETLSFKFPADSGDTSPPVSSGGGGHSRSRSLAYGQQSFKFPASSSPEAPAPSNSGGSLLPPTPNFSITHSPDRGHQRRSSHYRSNSRNFDPNGATNMNGNWRHQRSNSAALEPPSFVPGHKPRNSSFGGGSISSMSLFSNNGNNSHNNNSNGRKSLFAPYLPQSSLPELINDGRLVTGTLRVNKKNRSDAYVSTYGLLDADIFICGSKDRNRALEGDLVAIELLVVDEVWELKKEKEEKKRRKDNTLSGKAIMNDDIHNDATSAPTTSPQQGNGDENDESPTLGRRGSLKQRPTMKKNDDVEVEGQSLLLVEEEEINDEIKPLYAGHVVAVVDRIPGQLFAGTLGLLRPAQAAQAAKDKKNGKELSIQTPKAPKIVWFKPTDKKVPLIAIPTDQAPKDFVENHEKYANELFVALIKRWPITSLHPFGTLVSKLGKIDDPATEIDSILRDNNFLCDEYLGEEASGYELPSIELELDGRRTEYLDDYIIAFTQNNQFVDHALHVKRLSETKIELVFHTVDISYFVRPGSVLDRKAKKRFTSVFLPQSTTHLYPDEVIEALSFKENTRNLAVSVVFEIDCTNFEVEDLYIHESVIATKQIVSYDEVDSILQNELEGVKANDISLALQDYVRTFGLIAKEFRRQRLDNRQLGLTPNLTLMDHLDDEKVRLDLNIFKDSLAFDMVSEIVHKVNNAIAAKVHAGLGDKAFLRCHPLPTLQKVETFVRKASNLGFKIDTTNALTLQNSILKIEDSVKRQAVETLLFKCMSRGKYYVAGKQDPDSFGHYYFNLPLYTHFNAPIRRYADLIVHRQLKQVLNKQDEERELDSLKTIADYCNFKKDCAANAQQQAIHLLLSQTINEISENAGQFLCMGTVVQVYESAFDVFIPEFGVEKRVHGDQLPLVKAEFDKSERILELFWEKGVDSATYVPPDEQSLLSYRSSIKNKHRTSASQVANLQKSHLLTELIAEKLEKMSLTIPRTKVPELEENSGSTLAPFLKHLITRVDGDSYIQVVKELQQVPVLIRAEIGMALPCLTVRVLNPFAE